MKTTFLALIAALAPLCASKAHTREVQTKTRTTFCHSIADADQYLRCIIAGDDVAAVAFFEAKARQVNADGNAACWEEPPSYYTISGTQPGTIATMECLQLLGFTTCGWTQGVSHMPYNR